VTDWTDCSDELIAPWAADSQARTRAYAVYGSATEVPTAEDEAAIAEWKRRNKEAGAQ
jgi:hypothetical protein